MAEKVSKKIAEGKLAGKRWLKGLVRKERQRINQAERRVRRRQEQEGSRETYEVSFCYLVSLPYFHRRLS
jgi:hypothetical protein